MEQAKYGIKIPWPDVGNIWFSEHGPSYNSDPKLFTSIASAQKYAEQVLGGIAKVEQYTGNTL